MGDPEFAIEAPAPRTPDFTLAPSQSALWVDPAPRTPDFTYVSDVMLYDIASLLASILLVRQRAASDHAERQHGASGKSWSDRQV